MKRVNRLFVCFFLLFLLLSSIPVLLSSALWLKKYWIQLYDNTMKKYSIRVYAPTRKMGTPYRDSRSGSLAKLPKENKRTKHLRPLRDFLKHLLPKQKDFEKQLIAKFPFRYHFSECNMAFKRMIGMKKPIEYNSAVFLPDHALRKSFWEPLTRPDEIRKYQQASRKVKAKFFYLVRSISTSPENGIEEIYPGFYDYTNQKINDSIKVLRKMKIPYLDLRHSMGQFSRNEEFKKLFFKGDHHWKVDGALLGAKLTADYMNRHCGTKYDLRFFDPEVFYRVRYKDIFIGSMGKILSLAYLSEKEDMDVLYPDYKTDFSLEEPFRKFCTRGNFSVLFQPQCNYYNSYHANNYGIFLFGYKELFRITNNLINRRIGKKILIISDSFTNSLAPYLALQTREIVMVDPRKTSCDEILKHIRQEKPDIVFSMFYLNFAPAAQGKK